MSDHNELGNIGERVAQNYLKEQNYEILETNWRYRRAELDIICKKDDVLIFIEVKTRSTDAFGQPEEFVSECKERLMFQAANEYMELIDHQWEIRFDIISVVKKAGGFEVKHFEDAFFPGL